MTDGERTTARHAARIRGGVVLDHLAAGHDLPIANGWTRYGGAAAVWCGWCQHLYRPPPGWAERYLTARWRALAQAAASASNRTTPDGARRKIRSLAGALADAGVAFDWRSP